MELLRVIDKLKLPCSRSNRPSLWCRPRMVWQGREEEKEIRYGSKNKEREREVDRQTDRQREREVDRQTDTERERGRERERERDRQTERERGKAKFYIAISFVLPPG